MALLRQRHGVLQDAARQSTRWIRNVSQKLIDGEDTDSLFDIQYDAESPSPPPTAKTYPPVEVPQEEKLKSKFEIPSKAIRLEQIRPDFHATAVGRFLADVGMEGLAFERFTERNPYAFHLTQKSIVQWSDAVRRMLEISASELRCVLELHPGLLSVPMQHIQTTLQYLSTKLKLAQSSELRTVVLENPFVFNLGFKERCDRASSVLFERFKITIPELKRISLRSPLFLTRMEEGLLFSLATLFESLIGMSQNQVGKMLRDAPELLSHSLFGLQERLSFLIHYQIAQSQIRDMLMQCPELLDTHSTAQLRHVVNFLEATLNAEAKLVRKMMVYEPSILRMDTEKQITPNLSALKNLGFSRHEATLMIVRCPQILTLTLYDAQTEQKLRFLRTELDREPPSLLTYPQYLTCSWTEVLLPRVAFLRRLKRADYKQWPLMKLFGDSDSEFCTRHVRTVPEKFKTFREKWTKTERAFLTRWAPELL